VQFLSSSNTAATLATQHPYPLPYVKHKGSQLPWFNFIRKPASDFGWDWGPAIAPVGLSGRVYLITVPPQMNGPLLDTISVSQHHHHCSNNQEECGVTLTVDVDFLSATVEEERNNSSIDDDDEDTTVIVRASLMAPLYSSLHSYSNKKHRYNDLPLICQNITYAKKQKGGGGGTSLELKVAREDVHLWWPWDMGDQPLYTIKIDLVLVQGEVVLDSIKKQLGLRYVELVTEPITKSGEETFYFKVNGVGPLFARGANIVPPSIFSTDDTDAKLHSLIDNAKSAGMNMVRAWGGGRPYFPDSFYSAADALGVLIWQEAAFACAVYPVRSLEFIKEVKREVRQHARRLSLHPSVVIWGGNNEVEASLQWFNETRDNLALYAVDYQKLFVDMEGIRGMITMSSDNNNDNDISSGSTVYLDGSPTNWMFPTDNKTSSGTSWVKRWGNVGSKSTGDIHFYDYTNDWLDAATYPSSAKFISEFGIMSFPSFESYIQQVPSPDDWKVSSPMTEYRLRHAGGYEEMNRQLQQNFLLHSSTSDGDGAGAGAGAGNVACSSSSSSPILRGSRPIITTNFANTTIIITESIQSFQAWIYLTQVQQALGYSTAISTWRRNKSVTAGVLYWQLNDIWAGPSWSSINVDGRWKALHYQAARFFSPVYISGRTIVAAAAASIGRERIISSSLLLEVHLTNDYPCDIEGTVKVTAIPFVFEKGEEERVGGRGGRKEKMHGRIKVAKIKHVQIAALKSSLVANIDLSEHDEEISPASHFIFLDFKPKKKSGCPVPTTIDTWESRKKKSSNVVFMTSRFNEMALSQDAVVRVVDVKLSNSTSHPVYADSDGSAVFDITIDADKGVALFVMLSTKYQGQFTDNFIPFVMPGQPVVLSFQMNNEEDDGGSSNSDAKLPTPSQFAASLRIEWLQQAQNILSLEREKEGEAEHCSQSISGWRWSWSWSWSWSWTRYNIPQVVGIVMVACLILFRFIHNKAQQVK
jgi:beta-mannosidase